MRKRFEKKSKLDIEIDQLTLQLKDHESTSKEYAKLVKRMTELHKIRQDQQPETLSPNTLLTSIVSILGILLITKYEYENVVKSKAIGFVKKV